MPSKGSRLLVHFNTAKLCSATYFATPVNLVIFLLKQDDFTLLLSSEAGTIDPSRLKLGAAVATVGAFLCCSAAQVEAGMQPHPVAERRTGRDGIRHPSPVSVRPRPS